jgi:transposase-like protein
VEAWQNRPLAAIYPIVYLDAIHLKLRRDGKVLNTAVYSVLGSDLEGQRDVLGHWVGDGAEGANFWLSVVTDLQTRGVSDIFLACVDGLTGFKAAIQAVFPKTHIKHCIIHQVRHSLTYVTWKDRKVFTRDLRAIYQAPTREAAETELRLLSEKWGATYAVAVRSWETHWEDLATMFDYPAEIRRLIYTTNTIEGYNRQLRKVTKTKGAFPTAEAARKLRVNGHARHHAQVDDAAPKLGLHPQPTRDSVRRPLPGLVVMDAIYTARLTDSARHAYPLQYRPGSRAVKPEQLALCDNSVAIYYCHAA